MTAPPPPPLRIGAGADQGKVREENQDRISRFRSPFGEVFVVADGVGGYQGGAQAAEMVINGLEAHLRDLPADMPPAQALQEAARRTGAEIHQRAHSGDPATSNMGATGVLALLAGWTIRVGHAGDCRAYLLRGDELIRLTRDHTRIQQMLERNLLSEEEARDHPDASVVTRAFGKEPALTLEVSEPFDLHAGDLLLLSSDGLCGYVDDGAIRVALRAGGDAQEIADRLIALALAAGGEDNVSVQVVALPGTGPAASPLPPAAPSPALGTTGSERRSLPWSMITALLVLAFLAGWLIPWGRLLAAGVERWRDKEPKEVQSDEPERKRRDAERREDQERRMAPVPNERPAPDGEKAPPTTGPSGDVPEEPEPGAPAEREPPKPPQQGGGRVRILILGDDVQGSLEDLLRRFFPEVVTETGEKPKGFPRGRVYFRETKHKPEAERMSRELTDAEKPRSPYKAEPWPEKLTDVLRHVEILVVSWEKEPKRDAAAGEQEPESTNPAGAPSIPPGSRPGREMP